MTRSTGVNNPYARKNRYFLKNSVRHNLNLITPVPLKIDSHEIVNKPSTISDENECEHSVDQKVGSNFRFRSDLSCQ